MKGYLTEVVDEDAHVLLRFFGWVSWYNRNRYCSCCGHVTQLVVNQSEKRCVSCGLSSYPSWSLAIMVLLKKGRQVLLARSSYFRAGMYSALAGFVDIGESAEDALCREVNEEVGL